VNIEWRKSSRSDNGVGGECVEVANFSTGVVAEQDAKGA
jgi:Domain of unknown function (DUF397)